MAAVDVIISGSAEQPHARRSGGSRHFGSGLLLTTPGLGGLIGNDLVVDVISLQ